MGRGDSRRSPKMKRRRAQNQKKARGKRQIESAKKSSKSKK